MVKSIGHPKRRVGRPKSKPSCSACKQRRLKCDETLPTCQHCRSSGSICEGLGGKSSIAPQSLSSSNTSPSAITRAITATHEDDRLPAELAANPAIDASSPQGGVEGQQEQNIQVPGHYAELPANRSEEIALNGASAEGLDIPARVCAVANREGFENTLTGKRTADITPESRTACAKRARKDRDREEGDLAIVSRAPSVSCETLSEDCNIMRTAPIALSRCSERSQVNGGNRQARPREGSTYADMHHFAAELPNAREGENHYPESPSQSRNHPNDSKPFLPPTSFEHARSTLTAKRDHRPSESRSPGTISTTQGGQLPSISDPKSVDHPRTQAPSYTQLSSQRNEWGLENCNQGQLPANSTIPENLISQRQDFNLPPRSNGQNSPASSSTFCIQTTLPPATVGSLGNKLSRNCQVLTPPFGVYPVDVILWQDSAAFHRWYLAETGISNVSTLLFELHDVIENCAKTFRLPLSNSGYFQMLKQWIWDIFSAASELNDAAHFRILITPTARLIAANPQSCAPRPDRLPELSPGFLSPAHGLPVDVLTQIPCRRHRQDAPEITVRLQIDRAGKVSNPYNKRVLSPTGTDFFPWFTSQTGRGGSKGPLSLRFTFKDAMPCPATITIAQVDKNYLNLMIRELQTQFERAREYVPNLKEFAVLVADPEWVLEEDW
ncbi:uncharacterized protein BP5553_09764 [Venustampulla echinocandica]|uniref:Zn(2)-C6 fungal-type domain-containing protein n=1 Tax=Venustampulla echinocandica TaxID=2656787 RepID=A0A370TBY1_9HELO|nr:uncharacterized protein BP5553_09764 [Venustampulla echinocandica]RDL31555.1 hypothetical protein BP5553_09764 [Venustampulla echinocandica]